MIRTLVILTLAVSSLRAQVSAGTQIKVRTIDAIESKNATLGQTFKASLEEPIEQGKFRAPKGAEVLLKLTGAQSAGRLTGNEALTIALESINVGGQAVPVKSEGVAKAAPSKTKRSLMKIGIGAAAGAAIGGAAGGGKGAVIGSGAGAAGGAAVAMMTSGPEVRIPSETVLVFTSAPPQ